MLHQLMMQNYEQWDFLTKAAFNSCKSYPVAALHSFLKS